MAGVPGQKMRLIVGVNEFSGQISEMTISDTVQEIDDSVAQTDDKEYISGQEALTLASSGRWTGEEKAIDAALTAALAETDLAAFSTDGDIYDICTFNKTSKSVNGSLPGRVNVSMGLRYTEGDRIRGKELFRQEFDTTAANTTLTGDIIDLGAAQVAASRNLHVYYMNAEGGVSPLAIRIRASATRGGPYATSRTINLPAAAINTDLAARRPVRQASSYALARYVRCEVDVSGANRSGEIVLIATNT